MTNEVSDTPEFGPIYFNLRQNYTNKVGNLTYYYTLPTISIQSKRLPAEKRGPSNLSAPPELPIIDIPLPLWTKDCSIAPLF